MRHHQLYLTILIIATMWLSGCTLQPRPPAQPTPTATLLPPLARAIDLDPEAIILPIPIDPPSFNAYINDTGYEELVGELVYGALAELSPTGDYYPELAQTVPTLDNGGVSDDGLTVTWQLRPGVKWSDGTPFTAEDVRFTWQALVQSGIYAPGIDLIADIETPDDLTAIIYYHEFYPNYRLQFGGEGIGIFPAHHCGNPAQMLTWDCNFEPISSGPFVLRAWEPGRRLIFERNPNYWAPERPLANQLILTIEAEPDVRERMLTRGDAHLDLWTEDPELSNLKTRAEEDGDVRVFSTNPPRFILKLIPNLSLPGSADAAQPHPALADVRVRQAIRHAINVPELITIAFNDHASPAHTELARNGCSVSPYTYNPATAQALLAQAGWVDEDGDGVRECRGCLYANEGDSLEFDGYYYVEFGDDLKRTYELIEVMLYEVGINLHPQPAEGYDLWKSWTDNGIEIRGDFNLDLWDDGYYGIDPTDYLYDLYDPRAIPTQDDPLAGLNVMRYRNPDLAETFDQLRTPLSDEARQKILCNLAIILYRDLPTIPLLALPDHYAANTRLQGVSPHIYDTVTWNAADWYLLPEAE